MLYDARPWGEYVIVYQGRDCQIKRLTIRSGQATSLQNHSKRNEHWVVVSGRGKVEVGFDLEVGQPLGERNVEPEDYIYVPRGA